MHNLGRPPRRLVLLHLDGSEVQLPPVGTPVLSGTRTVGVLGTSALHHELGPVALALVKRSLADDAPLEVAGVAAAVDTDLTPAPVEQERVRPGGGPAPRARPAALSDRVSRWPVAAAAGSRSGRR